MSSRVLKKLQGDVNLLESEKGRAQLSNDDDTDEDLLTHGKSKHFNPFDLLNQQSLSESEFKEDDNETENASAAANLPANPVASKKKKKKRKKKSKYTGNHISSEDMELQEKTAEERDTSVAREVDNFDESLLAVELKNLNANYEMRRTFGKRVVKYENKRGRTKLTLKSIYMVKAKDTWPPVTKNIITMKLLEDTSTAILDAATSSGSGKCLTPTFDSQIHWFAFEHTPYYQSVQNMFLPAIERTDSDFLIFLIKRCPYHIDSLIQLSELCKMTEDYALASELIERAVLVLETSLHPSFSLTSGNCRLDYRRQENRSFFIVLFKHAQYLEARACSRTALELSKLILNTNMDDPLAIVLVIDYYAIRSQQYAWLVKFYEQYNELRNLSQLPNMAFSYSLALFCLLGHSDKANKALQYALLMFPSVLRPLLNELSIETDRRVLNSAYFSSEVSGSQSPALHQLVCLYVCRAKVIWRQDNVLRWLEHNVNAVLDRFDKKDNVIAEYQKKRIARYVVPPRPILRHVILSDFKEKVPLAPFLSKEKQPIVMYDPLPPLDSVNCYDRKSSSSSPATGSNPSLAMFFQSILPNFNPTDVAHRRNLVEAAVPVPVPRAALPPIELPADDEFGRQMHALNLMDEDAEEPEANNDGEGAPTYHDITQSLTNIVDAMRDFLHNFRIAEHLQPIDREQNGSAEEDTSDY